MDATNVVYESKTRQEIEFLKNNWESDPCWNIESTEGFEAHAKELEKYRLEMEQEWANERFAEIDSRATALKCSMEVAEYIISLERKLERMQDKIDQLWYQSRI